MPRGGRLETCDYANQGIKTTNKHNNEQVRGQLNMVLY